MHNSKPISSSLEHDENTEDDDDGNNNKDDFLDDFDGSYSRSISLA